MVDITTETRPFSVATFQVPESPGGFCRRGGRFGPHSSSESFAPIFYKKLVFIAYFNAGVRAVDIRNPYAPRDVASYIPATTDRALRAVAHLDLDLAGQRDRVWPPWRAVPAELVAGRRDAKRDAAHRLHRRALAVSALDVGEGLHGHRHLGQMGFPVGAAVHPP